MDNFGTSSLPKKTHNLDDIKAYSQGSSVDSIVQRHYAGNAEYGQEEKKDNFFMVIVGGLVRWIFDSVQVIIIALAIFVVFYLFIFSPHTIEGPSMQPNFCNGDLVLADKLAPRFSGYEIGDVIIFSHDKQDDYIKRIIAKEDDVVKVENGKVYRNGTLIDESYLPSGRLTTLRQDDVLKEGQDYIVPKGKYLVFGDNRPYSLDSRSFGVIDPNVNTIKGKARVILWPISRVRIFDNSAMLPVNECESR